MHSNSKEPVVTNEKTLPKQLTPGTIKTVLLQNFMCHEHLKIELGPRINFIVGENGSGKSAVLTALTLALGASAKKTNRSSKNGLKDLIRTGQDKARVIVEIRNEGEDAYEREILGERIFVEKTITRSGASAIKIMDQNQKTVYNKKEELDRLCDHFNLDVDNPIVVMTQDGSREFLHSGKDVDKYRFFMKATLLESVLKRITLSKDRLIEMRAHLDEQGKKLPELESKAADLQTEFNNFTLQEELQKKFGQMQYLYPWAAVADQSKIIEKLVESIEATNDKLQEIDTALEKMSEKKDAHEARKLEAEEKAEKFHQGELKVALEKKEEYKEAMQAAERLVTSGNRSLIEATTNVKEKKRNRDNQKKLVEDEKDKAISMTQNVSGKHEAGLIAAKAKLEKLQNEKENFYAEERAKKQEEQDAEQALRLTHQEISRIKTGIDDQQRVVRNLENASRDTNARFGEHMPKLLAEINKNINKFSKPPIGPIGSKITLTDQNWGDCVEECCGRELDKFLVNSPKDVGTLQGIARSLNCRVQIACVNFDASRYDTKENKPDTQLTTVADVLDFGDNDTIHNFLVDKSKIERVILMKSDTQAMNIMHWTFGQQNTKNPLSRNVDYALTMERRKISQTKGTQSSNPFRSYQQGRCRLVADTKGLIVNAKKRLEDENAQLREANARLKAKAEAISIANRAVQILGKNREQWIRSVKEAQQAYDRKKKEKEEEEEDRVEIDLEELERDLQEKERLLRESEAEKSVLEEDLKQRKEDFEEKKAQLDRFTENQSSMGAQLDSLNDEISRAEEKMKKMDQNMGTAKKIKMECIDRCEKERKELEEKKNDLLEFEKHASKRSTFKSLEAAEALKDIADVHMGVEKFEAKIKQVKDKISREAQTHARPYEEVRDELEETKSKLNKRKRILEMATEPERMMTKMVKKRRILLSKTSHATAVDVSADFNYHMSKRRGCSGLLEVDFEGGQLAMTVDLNNKAVKNTASLSGGERSYATLALTLAMGEQTEAPFRAMDEFDVFMDDANRKVSIKSLLEFARSDEELGRQFILITPQDISSVSASDDDISIFKMRAARS
jgi:structural maintenance of chromosomes protein 6